MSCIQQKMDYDEFRRKLAGLSESVATVPPEANEEMREVASSLACLLAELFGTELDRLTLWSRIDSALKSACAKVTDGNLELFVNHCLEHVRADSARACNHLGLGMLLQALNEQSPEWGQAFTHYVSTRIYAVLVFGKQKWEIRKNQMKREAGYEIDNN